MGLENSGPAKDMHRAGSSHRGIVNLPRICIGSEIAQDWFRKIMIYNLFIARNYQKTASVCWSWQHRNRKLPLFGPE
jgi:hypothetical protein